MPGMPMARSSAVMAGRTVRLALKARNHGSAIAGNCDDSFMSKKMNPVRCPLPRVFGEMGGLRLEVRENLLHGCSQAAVADRRVASLDGNRNFHHHAHC